jgi:hypothetical protein
MRSCTEQSVPVPFSTLPIMEEEGTPYRIFHIIHSRNSVFLAHGASRKPTASKSSGNVPDLSARVTSGYLPSPRTLAKRYLFPSCHFKLTRRAPFTPYRVSTVCQATVERERGLAFRLDLCQGFDCVGRTPIIQP